MLKECLDEVKFLGETSSIHDSSRKMSLLAKLFDDVANNKEIQYYMGKTLKTGKIIENKFYKYIKLIFETCGLEKMVAFAKVKKEYYDTLPEDPVNIKQVCQEMDTAKNFSPFLEIDNGDYIAFNKISKHTWDKENFSLKSEDATNILEYFAALGYVLNFIKAPAFFQVLEKIVKIEDVSTLWTDLENEINKYNEFIESDKIFKTFKKFDTDDKKIEVLYYVKELLQYINDTSRYENNPLVEDFSKIKNITSNVSLKCMHSSIEKYYRWQDNFIDKNSEASKENTADVVFIFSENGVNFDEFLKSENYSKIEDSNGLYVAENKNKKFYFLQVSLKKGKKEARVGKITTDIRKDVGDGLLDEGLIDSAKNLFKKTIEFSKKVISGIKTFFSKISDFIKSLLDVSSAEKEINAELKKYFKKLGLNEEKFNIKKIIDKKETKTIIELGNKIVDNFLNNYKSFSKFIGFNKEFVNELKKFKNILNNLENYKKIDSPYNTPFSEAEFAQIVVNTFVLDYLYKFLVRMNEKSEVEIAEIIKEYERKSKMGKTKFNIFVDYLFDKKVDILSIGDFKFSGNSEIVDKIKELVKNYKLLYFEIKMTSSKDKEMNHLSKFLVINTYFIKDLVTEPTYYHLQWNKNGNTFRVEYNSEKSFKQIDKIMNKG